MSWLRFFFLYWCKIMYTKCVHFTKINLLKKKSTAITSASPQWATTDFSTNSYSENLWIYRCAIIVDNLSFYLKKVYGYHTSNFEYFTWVLAKSLVIYNAELYFYKIYTQWQFKWINMDACFLFKKTQFYLSYKLRFS